MKLNKKLMEINVNKKKESGQEKLYSQYNPDIVNYDGQETYNVTKGNLLTAKEKIVELTQVADTQKNEILRLKSQLESHQCSVDSSKKNELRGSHNINNSSSNSANQYEIKGNFLFCVYNKS